MGSIALSVQSNGELNASYTGGFGFVAQSGQTFDLRLATVLLPSSSSVTTIAGTANEVLVNGGTTAAAGAVTLSLPQQISTNSNVTFGNVTINGGLSIQPAGFGSYWTNLWALVSGTHQAGINFYSYNGTSTVRSFYANYTGDFYSVNNTYLQGNVAITGNITSGTWQGSIISNGYLQIATTTNAGVVRPDGTTITISAGVISAVGGGGGGNVSTSGTITSGYAAQWNGASSIISVANTGTGSNVLAASPSLSGTIGGTFTVGSGATWNGNSISATYLPTATTGGLGLVKPDGTTITISGGVISASGGGGTGNVTTSGSITTGYTAQWASSTSIAAVANTGSGSYVLATSPTLSSPTITGTITGVSETLSGNLTVYGNTICAATYGGGNLQVYGVCGFGFVEGVGPTGSYTGILSGYLGTLSQTTIGPSLKFTPVAGAANNTLDTAQPLTTTSSPTFQGSMLLNAYYPPGLLSTQFTIQGNTGVTNPGAVINIFTNTTQAAIGNLCTVIGGGSALDLAFQAGAGTSIYYISNSSHLFCYGSYSTVAAQITSTGLNNTVIGATTAAAASVTTLSASGAFTFSGGGTITNGLTVSGGTTLNNATTILGMMTITNPSFSNNVLFDCSNTSNSNAFVFRVGQTGTTLTPLSLTVNGCVVLKLTQALATPASSSATGNQGQIEWDANYVYVCTATNTWKRAALTTF